MVITKQSPRNEILENHMIVSVQTIMLCHVHRFFKMKESNVMLNKGADRILNKKQKQKSHDFMKSTFNNLNQ